MWRGWQRCTAQQTRGQRGRQRSELVSDVASLWSTRRAERGAGAPVQRAHGQRGGQSGKRAPTAGSTARRVGFRRTVTEGDVELKVREETVSFSTHENHRSLASWIRCQNGFFLEKRFLSFFLFLHYFACQLSILFIFIVSIVNTALGLP